MIADFQCACCVFSLLEYKIYSKYKCSELERGCNKQTVTQTNKWSKRLNTISYLRHWDNINLTFFNLRIIVNRGFIVTPARPHQRNSYVAALMTLIYVSCQTGCSYYYSCRIKVKSLYKATVEDGQFLRKINQTLSNWSHADYPYWRF